MATEVERFWSKANVQESSKCWEWRGARTTREGNWRGSYGVAFYHGRNMKAHRVAWELDNERPVPPGREVMHTCDNPPCVNPAHLRLGTHAENMADAASRKRIDARGERNGRAVLTWEIVRAIRAQEPTRGYLSRLAAEYGVSRGAIYRAHAGRAWTDASVPAAD